MTEQLASKFEAFEKWGKELKESIQARTKEQILEEVLERLKATYLKKNPYSPTNRFGDSFSQWNFEHSEEIRRLRNVLLENGREDLLLAYEGFVVEQEGLAEQEKRQKVIDKLLKVGIDLNKVQDPEVRKYIMYKELANDK